MLYRVFFLTLTLFFALNGVLAPESRAADTLTVKGVTVDVSGPSALDARKTAFAEARRKAYQQLATSMMPDTDPATIAVPDDKVIASMVREFEIVSEKMTSRRYVGTVNVAFSPAVKRTLAMAAAPVQETMQTVTDENGVVTTTTTTTTATTRAPLPRGSEDIVYSPRRAGSTSTPASANRARNILILPWYGPTGRQTLWEQGNPWRAAWEEKDSLAKDKAAPLLLPVGDVDDLRDYAPPQPLSRSGNIDALMKRYHAVDAVLALAEPQSNGGVVVSLYRYQGGAPVPMGRFGVDATERDVLGEAVNRTAAAVKAMPARMASEATPVSMGTPQTAVTPQQTGASLRSLVRFSGLQQWVGMRSALERVPGVGGIAVRAISPTQADIEFSYGGDAKALPAILAQSGLRLTALPPGSPAQYMISAGGVY